MPFIEQTELNDVIKSEILDDILDSNTEAFDEAARWAEEQARGYINERYDDDYEFARTGADRNDWLLGTIKDLLLFRLHLRINPRAVPELRETQCKMALKNLLQVQNGTFSPAGMKTRKDDVNQDESARRYSTETSGTRPGNW